MPRKKKNVSINLSDIPATEEQKSRIRELIGELSERPFESVYITSHDGLSLHARYYHARDGAPVQIQCHGYRGSGLRDFSGGANLALALGHNVLLIDQRGSGASEGHTTAFGILERHDVQRWTEYASARFPSSPIYLVGISMGAATVLCCRAMPLPDSVVGIIADCPYDTAEGIIAKVASELGFPAAPTMALMRLSARLLGGFDLRAASPLSAVESDGVPVLLIHGEGDRFVPHAMSENLARCAAGDFTFESFPCAEHGMSFFADPDRYRRTVTDFIARTLPEHVG